VATYDGYPRAAVVVAHPAQDFGRERGQLAHIVVGLAGQANDEVELRLRDPTASGKLCGLHIWSWVSAC